MDAESDPPDAGQRTEPRSAESRVVLRRHQLSHLRGLEVHATIFETHYPPGASTRHCRGTCCVAGVKVDVPHRDRILAHAGLVQDAMDAGQERDPRRWFEPRETPDPDFPSGRCVGTEVYNGGCVFLDGLGRCVLQTVTLAQARPGFDLKPFFCYAFPITIANGELWIDEMCLDAPVGCCRPEPGGPLGVLDVCEAELRHTLGNEGLQELRRAIEE